MNGLKLGLCRLYEERYVCNKPNEVENYNTYIDCSPFDILVINLRPTLNAQQGK